MDKGHLQSLHLNYASLAAGSMRALMVALVAAVSMKAHAEYRCASPASQEDRRACELAGRDSADGLRLFIQRTSPIYGLYFYDYVKAADFVRWESAHQNGAAPKLTALDSRNSASKAARGR